MDNQHLQSSFYCNHQDRLIHSLSARLAENVDDKVHFTQKAFFYIRDEIRFGGDLWQVKASETLIKQYGACFNKNVLFMALLRNQGIPCKLAAHPMRRDFTRPSTGAAHIFFSNPFFHCFTMVWINDSWIDIDPTLNKDNYETFFKPEGVLWDINWNENGMPPLYEESIMGNRIIINDIDRSLGSNLNSWFMFKHEPDFILRRWLWLGNHRMWKKIDKAVNKAAVKEITQK